MFVCPVSTGISSYRSISLLKPEDKDLERLKFSHLICNRLDDNDLLFSLQTGFLSGEFVISILQYFLSSTCFKQGSTGCFH